MWRLCDSWWFSAVQWCSGLYVVFVFLHSTCNHTFADNFDHNIQLQYLRSVPFDWAQICAWILVIRQALQEKRPMILIILCKPTIMHPALVFWYLFLWPQFQYILSVDVSHSPSVNLLVWLIIVANDHINAKQCALADISHFSQLASRHSAILRRSILCVSFFPRGLC